jgi:hypothetical protein
MSKYQKVTEVTTLAATINLLREWLSTESCDLGKFGPVHECYRTVLHRPTRETCGFDDGICVHGIWNEEGSRLGYCHGNDNQPWRGRQPDGGGESMHHGHGAAQFFRWASRHGFILIDELVRDAALWESENSWLEHEKESRRCGCGFCR